ncbi:MAG: hypothetical protein R6V50_07640 [Thermoplasmatota archaeon]
MITIFLIITFLAYVIIIQQIFGYYKRGRVVYLLITFIDKLCQKITDYSYCFNGSAWNPDIPLYKRIFASTTAISLFIIFPFITELGAENE